ncbi:chitooligosaccharide deacetylase NodB [soil metagenome]
MNISLTFDDGPDPRGTAHILPALHRARASATFFVVTPQARRYPRLVHEIERGGHRVEFHCAEHVRHTERTREEIEADTRSGLEDLAALDITPRLWRTPWGVTEPWTKDIANQFGLELTHWTADTHDWRGDSASEMLEAVDPLLRPGAIVLMHDGLGPGAQRTDCEQTAALIDPLVSRIRALGCEPAPIVGSRKVSVA